MVECDPERSTVCLTCRAIHIQPRCCRPFLCTIYQNRARTSPSNVCIWGMRDKQAAFTRIGRNFLRCSFFMKRISILTAILGLFVLTSLIAYSGQEAVAHGITSAG